MKVVYVAPHRTYVIDSDGSTLAIADGAPHELPQTVNSQSFGALYAVQPNRVQLVGAWLVYLQRLSTAMSSLLRTPGEPLRSYGDTLWSGEKFRIRYWRPGPRCKINLHHKYCMQFDREVTL